MVVESSTITLELDPPVAEIVIPPVEPETLIPVPDAKLVTPILVITLLVISIPVPAVYDGAPANCVNMIGSDQQ